MKQFINDLLSDSGKISTMRLMSLVSLFIGGVIAIYGVYRGQDLKGIAEISGVFVIAAFGGKAGQKVMEK